MSPISMTGSVIVRNGFWIGLAALLQMVAPAVVAIAFLYFLVFAFDAQLGRTFQLHGRHRRAADAAAAVPGERPQRPVFRPCPDRRVGPGRAGRSCSSRCWRSRTSRSRSAFYSRRIVLTWAIVTPALLVPVTILLQEVDAARDVPPAERTPHRLRGLQRSEPVPGAATARRQRVLHVRAGLLRRSRRRAPATRGQGRCWAPRRALRLGQAQRCRGDLHRPAGGPRAAHHRICSTICATPRPPSITRPTSCCTT